LRKKERKREREKGGKRESQHINHTNTTPPDSVTAVYIFVTPPPLPGCPDRGVIRRRKTKLKVADPIPTINHPHHHHHHHHHHIILLY